MFQYEVQRRIISNKLFEQDQSQVEQYVQQNALSLDSQDADRLMQDLDQTRIQRSVALVSYYELTPATQYDVAQLDVTYDLNTNFFHIKERESGELLSVGTLL